jgi:hypothetical protein
VEAEPNGKTISVTVVRYLPVRASAHLIAPEDVNGRLRIPACACFVDETARGSTLHRLTVRHILHATDGLFLLKLN